MRTGINIICRLLFDGDSCEGFNSCSCLPRLPRTALIETFFFLDVLLRDIIIAWKLLLPIPPSVPCKVLLFNTTWFISMALSFLDQIRNVLYVDDIDWRQV